MIKFKPLHENHNTGTLNSFKGNLHAIAESKVCNKLNEKNIPLKCENHPNIDSVILVDMKSEKMQYKIDSYCCEDFKPVLERFLSSEDTQD